MSHFLLILIFSLLLFSPDSHFLLILIFSLCSFSPYAHFLLILIFSLFSFSPHSFPFFFLLSLSPSCSPFLSPLPLPLTAHPFPYPFSPSPSSLPYQFPLSSSPFPTPFKSFPKPFPVLHGPLPPLLPTHNSTTLYNICGDLTYEEYSIKDILEKGATNWDFRVCMEKLPSIQEIITFVARNFHPSTVNNLHLRPYVLVCAHVYDWHRHYSPTVVWTSFTCFYPPPPPPQLLITEPCILILIVV